jgi:hypothetical protein
MDAGILGMGAAILGEEIQIFGPSPTGKMIGRAGMITAGGSLATFIGLYAYDEHQASRARAARDAANAAKPAGTP